MRKFIYFLCLFLFVGVVFESWYIYKSLQPVKPTPAPKPLLIYTFQNLRKTIIPKSSITLGEIVDNTGSYTSQMFYYQTPERPGSNLMEKVSGLMNIPSKPGNYPVIVMFRGFVPDNIYEPGIGTEPVAKVLAANGFITLAPDFLGFGKSDPGAKDSFENRFQTYTTAVSLLNSLSTLNSALDASYSGSITSYLSKIGIWGHSNGGHIALSTLAITGVKYPTVLWAPVSASFPYSILYYTDESDDQGKILRKVLANFENVYNTDLFSPSNYYKWINSPIDIEQGITDMEVPYWWSDSLVETLKKNKVYVVYNTHSGADHNMLPISNWYSAVKNTIEFYKNEF